MGQVWADVGCSPCPPTRQILFLYSVNENGSGLDENELDLGARVWLEYRMIVYGISHCRACTYPYTWRIMDVMLSVPVRGMARPDRRDPPPSAELSS